MKTLFLTIAVVLVSLCASPASAQVACPVTATAQQCATWARLKAENHPHYQTVLANGLKDNTPDARYVTYGRWGALAYRMSGDPMFAERSLAQINVSRSTKDCTTAPVISGNALREFGVELVVALDWIRDAVDVSACRGWLMRSADTVLTETQRLNDTDRLVGETFFLATMDRVFGTTYMTHPVAVAMRNALRTVITTYGKGGQCPESYEYCTGSLYLTFNGAEAAGIENFPEVAAFRAEVTRFFPHHFVPGLKDTFEWGDDQTPHDPRWINLDSVLAYLGHYSPEIRQFDKDLRAAWGLPQTTTLYPRYFVWTNPFAETLPWKPFLGTYAVAPGMGHVIARTGWDASDAAVMVSLPSFTHGGPPPDHTYPIFGDMWFFKNGWKVPRPVAYSANILLGNHTILMGLRAPTEVAALTGTTRIPGTITYASGTNAGVLSAVGRYLPPDTGRHEYTRSVYWLEDRDVLLVTERIHLEDATMLGRYAEQVDKVTADNSPAIETLWQSQSVRPVVANGVIQGDSRIVPLYPAIFEVVDLAPLALGTIAASEKKWVTKVAPTTPQPFQILNTLIGDATAIVEQLGDAQRVRVRKAGFPDAVIYSSAKHGPKLVTTKANNRTVHNPTKIDGILKARAVTVDPTWSEAGVDVYVEHADRLERIASPAPAPAQWRISPESTPDRLILERVE